MSDTQPDVSDTGHRSQCWSSGTNKTAGGGSGTIYYYFFNHLLNNSLDWNTWSFRSRAATWPQDEASHVQMMIILDTMLHPGSQAKLSYLKCISDTSHWALIMLAHQSLQHQALRSTASLSCSWWIILCSSVNSSRHVPRNNRGWQRRYQQRECMECGVWLDNWWCRWKVSRRSPLLGYCHKW